MHQRLGLLISSTTNPSYLRTQQIQLTCNEKDRYTTNESRDDTAIKGNGVLSNPVGLITSDEALASGVFGGGDVRNTYWLYTGQLYWTMSLSCVWGTLISESGMCWIVVGCMVWVR